MSVSLLAQVAASCVTTGAGPRVATYRVYEARCTPCRIDELAGRPPPGPNCGSAPKAPSELDVWQGCVSAALDAGVAFRAEAVNGGIDAWPKQTFGRTADGGLTLWREEKLGGIPCTTEVFEEACQGIVVRRASFGGTEVVCAKKVSRQVCSEYGTREIDWMKARSVTQLHCDNHYGSLWFGCDSQQGPATPDPSGPDLTCTRPPAMALFCLDEPGPLGPPERQSGKSDGVRRSSDEADVLHTTGGCAYQLLPRAKDCLFVGERRTSRLAGNDAGTSPQGFGDRFGRSLRCGDAQWFCGDLVRCDCPE